MSHQLDDHPAIQAFIEWVNQNSWPGLINPSSNDCPRFLPTAPLKRYFSQNNHHNLRILLHAVFPEDRLPVQVNKVAEKCSKVFCTLLLIGKARFIKQFLQHDHLQDGGNLPFDAKFPPNNFPSCPSDSDSTEFLRRFCDTQWLVCAPEIDYQVDRSFKPDRILPIIEKKELDGGGTSARLYKIKFHPDYNQLRSSSDVQPVRGDPFADTFVLKTYYLNDVTAHKYYDSEIKAFESLQTHTSNMIGFHGSFRQGDRLNIILEFADKGTLENYFEQPPPTNGEDIIKFWEGMFKLIGALMAIHQVPGDAEQPLQGWHQDVKPTNIFVSSHSETIQSPYEYEFKLADLGTTHFQKMVSTFEDSTAPDSRGTKTYGAPECCRTDKVLGKSRIDVKQNVDMWSLGAVFSEAAVWLVEQHRGVEGYRRDRRAATSTINIPEIKDTDCFHDGTRMLGVVRQRHTRLRNSFFRAQDVITGRVLTMVEDMLLDAEARPTKTRTFWQKSQDILRDAKEELETKKGNPSMTPKRPPPASSSVSSQSSSGIPHAVDRGFDNGGRFEEPPRTFSAPPVGSPANISPPIQKQEFLERALHRNASLRSHSNYTEPNSQMSHDPTITNDYANRYFTPQLPRAQSHDIGSSQPMHHLTQSMGGLDIFKEEGDEVEQRSRTAPGRYPSFGIPTDTNSQFGEALQPQPRHETSNQRGEISRNAPEGFGLDPYRVGGSEFYQPRQLSSGYTQNPTEGAAHVSSRAYNGWYSGTSSIPQVGIPATPYPNFNVLENNRQNPGTMSHPPRVLEDWPGAASQPIHQTFVEQRADNIPHNSIGNMNEVHLQHTSSTSPPHNGRFLPPEISLPLPDAPPPATSTPVERPKHKPPAVLPIGTAISWRNGRGRLDELEGFHLFGRLKQRDHVFIIDDSLTMSRLWQHVLPVFDVLAYIVKSADPDGIDLYFTMTEEKYNSRDWLGRNSSSKLLDVVRNRTKKMQQAFRGSTNITYRLTSILNLYENKLTDQQNSRRGGMVRPLSLYVLTDGAWEPGSDASSAIKKVVDLLTRFGYTKDDKQVGIQFISFGEDKVGLQTLEHLDNDLGQNMDIVDTTSSSDNVWKMLLGAIDKTFDET